MKSRDRTEVESSRKSPLLIAATVMCYAKKKVLIL
jgi:hypothetical protein